MTITRRVTDDDVMMRAEMDEEHYVLRAPGTMVPWTEEFMVILREQLRKPPPDDLI